LESNYKTVAIVGFLAYLALGLALVFFLIFKKKKNWQSPINPAALPDPIKALITLVLTAYGLVHVLSFIEVYLKTRVQFTSAGEYFSYMSLAKLVATSHAHYFGHATMYALTAAVFLFTRLSERTKTIFICLALSGGLLDVPSWWMIKYAGDSWEFFSALAGAMSTIGWGFMTLRILWELWLISDRH